MPHAQDAKSEIEPNWPLMLRLAKVYADPLRVEVIAACRVRELSPRMFHEEYGSASLARVLRAFDFLAEDGWLVQTRSETSDSGQVESFYRADEMPVFDEATLPGVPDQLQVHISSVIFDGLCDRVRRAMEAGTMGAREDEHLSWTALALDRRGWETMISRVDALFYSLSELQREADARMAETGERAIPVTVALAGFESPPDGETHS